MGEGRDDIERTATVAALGFTAALVLDPAGWFPFSIAKWWAVMFVLLLALARWSNEIRLRRDPALIGLVALSAIVAVTSVVGLDPHHALLGTPVRHLGVIAWASFAAAFALGDALGSMGRRTPIAQGMVVVAIPIGVYLAWELAIGRPVDFAAVSNRLGGPFGSPAYLGAMACLLVPIPAAVAIDQSTTRSWRVASSVATGAAFLAAFGSGSRAALIGLAVGAAVWGAAKRRVGSSWLIGLVVVVALGAWQRGVFERSAGWATRLDEWQLALRMIAQRPLLGTGAEGYRIAAFELVDDDYVTRFGATVSTDRAHSGVLDVAASAGLIAALVYIAVLVFVVRAAWRAVRSDQTVDAGLGVAVIAYAVGQQLLFPIAEIDPIFWLLAGALMSRTATQSATRGRTRRLAASGCAALALIFGVLGVRAVAADRVALDAALATTPDEAVAAASRSVELAPNDLRHQIVLARSESATRSLAATDRAIAVIERALGASPRDPNVRLEHARLLSTRADITGDTADRERAAGVWSQLVGDAPSCARCHLGLALTAGERGDMDAARDALERAAQLGNDDAARLLATLDR